MRSGAKAPSKAETVKRACVIGWPVAHSRSPVIHRYWLKLYGLEGDYEREAVRPEEIEHFLRTLGGRGIHRPARAAHPRSWGQRVERDERSGRGLQVGRLP